MTEEEWRSVPGYEGLYEVSSLGRVRSLDRSYPHRLSGVPIPRRGKNLKLNTSGRYTRVSIGGKSFQVHRLVALAFIPNPEDYPVVRHLDDDKVNNSVMNLAWGTYRDNSLDATRNGLNHNALKTHCPQNHEYTEESTYYQRKEGTTSRICRVCQRLHDAERRRERLPERDHRHGTIAGYRRHKCKCEKCIRVGREHNNRTQNERRERRRAEKSQVLN